MRNILLIIQREYLTRIRNRFFILSTILTPLLIGAILAGSILITTYTTDKKKFLVIDETGWFKGKLRDPGSFYFKHLDIPIDSAKLKYERLGFNGVIHVPSRLKLMQTIEIEYISEDQIGVETKFMIERIFSNVVKARRMEKLDIEKETLDRLEVDLVLNTVITSDEGDRMTSSIVSTVVGYLTGIMIYMMLLIYGTMVMRGVIEEKTNRIVEVIISSVKPFQLMVGKIVGIAGVGLTQFMIWIAFGAIVRFLVMIIFAGTIMEMKGKMTSSSMLESGELDELASLIEGLSTINFPMIIISFIFFFLGGYLIYATLFAAVGSAANDESDVQSLTFPVTIPVILSFFLMMAAVRDPQGPLAFWASMFPLSSPLVMPARIPFGIPVWELLLSMALLIIGFLGSAWLAGRIYRTGILMYGKKVTLREMIRWVRR